MRAGRRVNPALSILAGYVMGAGAVSALLLGVTKSASTALTFTVIPLGFLAPIVLIFAIAPAYRSRAKDRPTRRTDVPIAVAYVLAFIPYWFAVVSLVKGRVSLGLVLLCVYVMMAAGPLWRMLHLRIAILRTADDRNACSGVERRDL